MSVSPQGKYNDHYAILGVDASAETEVIQRAYARLLERYGPDNIDTRDDEKLAVINTAYETLSDPEKRQAFDTLKGIAGGDGRPKFMGIDFFDVLGREVGLRGALLCILYDRRRNRPTSPALSMRHIEAMLDAPMEALTFALWYLKQRGYVTNDDKSNLQITVEGMDFLETHRPNPDDVMPFIKPAAISGRQLPPKPAPEKLEGDSVQEMTTQASSPG
ncbi:MAG TPA: J domain-containing protein [Bryobacteraceae bacterium]|nr:J domain-containing protein [Bryobacteraceae bacterium]